MKRTKPQAFKIVKRPKRIEKSETLPVTPLLAAVLSTQGKRQAVAVPVADAPLSWIANFRKKVRSRGAHLRTHRDTATVWLWAEAKPETGKPWSRGGIEARQSDIPATLADAQKRRDQVREEMQVLETVIKTLGRSVK